MVYLFHLFQPSFSFFNINLPDTPSLSLLRFKTKLKQRRTSLVTEWLRICLLTQQTQIQTVPWRRKWQLITPDSCLGNPMGREAWWATVHGIAKSQTRLSNLTTKTKPKKEHKQHPLISFQRDWKISKGHRIYLERN